MRTRFGRNHRHSFCWAYRCSVSRCSRFLAGFSVDAHTFAPGTILMPHGRKHDLPKPYERLPEASQKRDRGLPGGSKPTPNQKTILPKHCTPKPAQKPLDASKKLPKAFQKLPKGLPEGRPSLPKRVKTTRQILVANVVKTGAGIPLSKALGIRGNLQRRPGVANLSNGP